MIHADKGSPSVRIRNRVYADPAQRNHCGELCRSKDPQTRIPARLSNKTRASTPGPAVCAPNPTSAQRMPAPITAPIPSAVSWHRPQGERSSVLRNHCFVRPPPSARSSTALANNNFPLRLLVSALLTQTVSTADWASPYQNHTGIPSRNDHQPRPTLY